MNLKVVEPADDNAAECTERHCDEEHPDYDPQQRDEGLREAIRSLVESFHATHDTRFPWSLCSRDACRDTAIALGLRP